MCGQNVGFSKAGMCRGEKVYLTWLACVVIITLVSAWLKCVMVENICFSMFGMSCGKNVGFSMAGISGGQNVGFSMAGMCGGQNIGFIMDGIISKQLFVSLVGEKYLKFHKKVTRLREIVNHD
jgi:hypothetical protein